MLTVSGTGRFSISWNNIFRRMIPTNATAHQVGVIKRRHPVLCWGVTDGALYLRAVKCLAQKLRSILGDVGVIFVTVLQWDFGGMAPRYLLSISQHLVLAVLSAMKSVISSDTRPLDFSKTRCMVYGSCFG